MKHIITHLSYSGMAGSPRLVIDMVLNTDKQEFISKVVFFGQPEVREEYSNELKENDLEYSHIKKVSKYNLSSYFKAASKIKLLKTDIAVIHGIRNIFISMFLKLLTPKTKICLIHHGPVNEIKKGFWHFITKVAFYFSDAVICVSDDVLNVVKAKKERKADMICASIPNGIQISEYEDKSDKIFTDPKAPIKLSMLALLTKQKDHSTLIKAIFELRRRKIRFILELAGDGPLKQELVELSEQLDLKDYIIFRGFVNRKEVKTILSESDIYVHSTHSEGLSISILQAISTGLPIVATDVPGMSNLIDKDVNINLVTENDPISLADTIEKLIKNPVETKKQGKENRLIAEKHFSIANTTREYIKIWKKLLNIQDLSGENLSEGNKGN